MYCLCTIVVYYTVCSRTTTNTTTTHTTTTTTANTTILPPLTLLLPLLLHYREEGHIKLKVRRHSVLQDSMDAFESIEAADMRKTFRYSPMQCSVVLLL